MRTKHRQTFFASRTLASRGYNEVITFSFLNKTMAKQFNGGSEVLNLVNPISSELTDMRPQYFQLYYRLHKKISIKSSEDISFFEVGPIFIGDNPEEQINTITGIRIGHKIKKDWKNEPVKFDFYDVKIDVLKALEA